MKKLYIKGCISDKKNAFRAIANKKGRGVPFEIGAKNDKDTLKMMAFILEEARMKINYYNQ